MLPFIALLGSAAASVASAVPVATTATVSLVGGKLLWDTYNKIMNDKNYSEKEKKTKLLEFAIKNVDDDIKNGEFSVSDVSNVLGVSTETIRRKIREGGITVEDGFNSKKEGYKITFSQLVLLSNLLDKEDVLAAYLMTIMWKKNLQKSQSDHEQKTEDVSTVKYESRDDAEIKSMEKESLIMELELLNNQIKLIDMQLADENDLKATISLQKEKLELYKKIIEIRKQM